MTNHAARLPHALVLLAFLCRAGLRAGFLGAGFLGAGLLGAGFLGAGLLGAGLLGWGGLAAAGEPDELADSPNEPLVEMLAGERPCRDAGEFDAVATSFERTDRAHYAAVPIPLDKLSELTGGNAQPGSISVKIRPADGDSIHAVAMAQLRETDGDPTIIVRWPRADGSAKDDALPPKLEIALYSRGSWWWRTLDQPWARVVAHVDLPWKVTASKEGQGLSEQFWKAASDTFGALSESNQAHPVWSFFTGRALWLASPDGRVHDEEIPGRRWRPELVDRMALYTGMTSVEETLQVDRGLRVREVTEVEPAGPDDQPAKKGAAKRGTAAKSKPAGRLLADIPGVPLATHPWKTIVPGDNAGPSAAAPLAKLVPDDALYVHFPDLRTASRLADELSDWIRPLAGVLEGNGGRSELVERYQSQLAIERTILSKTLGHLASDGVALIAADPFLREGGAVAIAFHIKNRALLTSSLDRFAQDAEAATPNAKRETVTVAGVSVEHLASPDRTLDRWQFELDDALVLANSRSLVEAIVATHAGDRPSLATSGDFLAFRRLMPRPSGSAAPEEAFAFLSDAFVAKAVSPRAKIGSLRRVNARAELQAVAHAALLAGWMTGKAPQSERELVAGGWLQPDELEHATGGAIRYTPATGPYSAPWGSLRFTTPIDELTLERASEAEARAYEEFATSYQQYWRTFIDPVGVQISRDASGWLALDARIMPLIESTDYDEFVDMVGRARLAPVQLENAAQWTFAIGQDAQLRRQLDAAARTMGPAGVHLSWLGDWVAIGTLDSAGLWDLALLAEGIPERGEQVDQHWQTGHDRLRDRAVLWPALARAPLYAMAEVKNPLALGATLAALKGMAESAAPGLFDWAPTDSYRDVAIVRVAPDAQAAREPGIDKFAVHYATAKGVFVVAAHRPTIEALIDQLLDGKQARVSADSADEGPQVSVSFDARGGGKWMKRTALGMAEQLLRGAAVSALREVEVLHRGLGVSPADAAAFAAAAHTHLSHVPDDAHHAGLVMAEDQFVRHALYGTEASPAFPAIPIADSPLTALVDKLAGAEAAFGFEGKGATRSLHVWLRLQSSDGK